MRVYQNLIVIDGLDGVGKTSTVLELEKVLSRMGFDVIIKQFEKEYFQNAFAESRKGNNPNTKYFLQLAALTKLGEEIKSASSEKIIISDRYIYSVNAYYSALPSLARTSEPVTFFAMPEPQLKVLLECGSKTRRQRLLSRDGVISDRKAMTLTEFGDRIHSEMLTYSRWTRINNENLTVSESVSLITRQYR